MTNNKIFLIIIKPLKFNQKFNKILINNINNNKQNNERRLNVIVEKVLKSIE